MARINDHIADIGVIERLATDYWLSPGAAEAGPEMVAAARLRGATGALLSFQDEAARLFGVRLKAYDTLDGALYDAATGGPFETAGRAADPGRAVAVITTCHALRALLRSQRLRLFGAF